MSKAHEAAGGAVPPLDSEEEDEDYVPPEDKN